MVCKCVNYPELRQVLWYISTYPSVNNLCQGHGTKKWTDDFFNERKDLGFNVWKEIFQYNTL